MKKWLDGYAAYDTGSHADIVFVTRIGGSIWYLEGGGRDGGPFKQGWDPAERIEGLFRSGRFTLKPTDASVMEEIEGRA